LITTASKGGTIMVQFGSDFLLDLLVDYNTANPTWTLHLLSSDLGDITFHYNTQWLTDVAPFQCTFKGYAAVALTGVAINWDAGNKWVILTANDVTFSYNAAAGGVATQTVDHWALTNDTGGILFVCGDQFQPAILMRANGDQVTFTVAMKLFEDAVGVPDP
jgi:hypothetical protein